MAVVFVPSGFAEMGLGMKSKKHIWFRPRRYLHFDPYLGTSKPSQKRVEKLVKNPDAIKSHSFYPFISYEIRSRKVSEDKTTGKLRTKIKSRPISYAAHMDSQIYAYYSYILSIRYEQKLKNLHIDNSVLAFRALNKSNIDFALEAFEAIRNSGGCEAIAFDISGFFNNLDHEILKKAWAYVLDEKFLPDDHFTVFKSLTKHSLVDKLKLYKQLNISLHNPKAKQRRICTPAQFRAEVRDKGLIKVNPLTKGIPQGSPISALLSNIYMLQFDTEIAEIINEVGGHYYRYCDDMLFILPKEFASHIEKIVRDHLKRLKVDINTEKTEKRTFRARSSGGLISLKPLQYLGFTFDGQRILLRSASLAKYSERMKKGVALAKSTKFKKDKLKLKRGMTESTVLYRRKLYERYSHLGRRNFISYGHRASKKMKSKAINRQLKPLWKRLHDEIYKGSTK